MSEKKKVEIICRACGQETLLIRKPKYEGLRKAGDILSCSGCGHVYEEGGGVPYREASAIRVFDDSDRSETVSVFKEDENRSLCRYCRHYVVNPFTQWCGIHKKEVAATDTCAQFSVRPESTEEDPL